MNTKFGNAEMQYVPLDEIHTPHDWRCCWFDTMIEVITILAIGGGLALIAVLAFMLTGQINASV